MSDASPARGRDRWLGAWARAIEGRVRFAFVLFGGMLVLQSSATLDPAKAAYLVGTLLCLLGATVAVWRSRRRPEVQGSGPWLIAVAALVGLIAISFFVARSEGTSFTDWVRDVAAYALFAAVPVLALDAQESASRQLLVAMLVLAGVLGGLSWAVEWLHRRQILDLPLARLVFPSGQLPGMLYLFAMATALAADRWRIAWAGLAGLILGLFLLTGTRSSLLILIATLAMVALAGRARIGAALRSLTVHGVVAIAAVLAFQLALSLPALLAPGPGGSDGGASGPPTAAPGATSGPTVIGGRIEQLPAVIGDPGSDPSFKERAAQYRATWSLFLVSPIVGVGPGHQIEWIDVSGYSRTGPTADTPLVLLAKFGLLGLIVTAGLAGAYAITARDAVRRDRRSAIALALVGFAVWTVVSLPLGFPVEDKGTSLALMLLLALAFAEQRADAGSERSPAGEALGPRPETASG